MKNTAIILLVFIGAAVSHLTLAHEDTVVELGERRLGGKVRIYTSIYCAEIFVPLLPVPFHKIHINFPFIPSLELEEVHAERE